LWVFRKNVHFRMRPTAHYDIFSLTENLVEKKIAQKHGKLKYNCLF